MKEREESEKKRRVRTRAEIEHDRRFREVRREFAEGRMPLLLRRYLAHCGHDEAVLLPEAECGEVEPSETVGDPVRSCGDKRRTARSDTKALPNPAGFCRFLELEREAYARLEAEFPTEAGRMRAVFEDEALNSGLPATVLGFYLKYLLGAEGEDEAAEKVGDIFVSFDHDILSDGR